MKIGIMSMQRICNYGSFLQAYGLKSMLEDLGYEVEFVDYKVEPCIGINKFFAVKRKISKALFIPQIKEIYREKIKEKDKAKAIRLNKIFEKRYIKEFLPLLGVEKVRKYRSKVDTLIIGSDEVFNCLQQNEDVGFSKELFGYRNNAKKVITYAASFGNTTIERLNRYGKKEEIAALLPQINTISVRDSNSEMVVKSLLSKEPLCHMDPVLMYDYSKLIDMKCVKHKNYMIIYAYGGRILPEEALKIKEFAKKHHKKLISISGYQEFCDEHLILNPFEVLAYFKKADYIITDTFHGSIFSIINQKEFVTIIRKTENDSYGNEEKLLDLLQRLKLTDRELKDMSDLEVKFSKKTNYNVTDMIITEQRERTIEYLRKNV